MPMDSPASGHLRCVAIGTELQGESVDQVPGIENGLSPVPFANLIHAARQRAWCGADVFA
jgi:hypothetical protein